MYDRYAIAKDEVCTFSHSTIAYNDDLRCAKENPVLYLIVRNRRYESETISAHLYAIADRCGSEIVEETEKRSIYAADDRATVREELEKLENLYRDSVSTSPAEQGEEIRRRVEQRIREFRNAVQEPNKADLED